MNPTSAPIGFTRRDGVLQAEALPLHDIAARFGSPTYVYSQARLLANLSAVVSAAPKGTRVCYAVKANANMALLELLSRHGCDFDAGSAGELARLLALGIAPERIILSGVGKRDREIAAALAAGVLYLTVESEEEIKAVARVARALDRPAALTLRINPDVDGRTHPHIATGLRENKFGIARERAADAMRLALGEPAVRLCGLTCHIGSQIVELSPFAEAASRMAELAREALRLGAPLAFIGVGGGLGIRYREEMPPAAGDYVRAVSELLSPLGLTLVLEPGRVIVADAGLLLTRVIRTKHGAERDFVIVDAGMNDLIRPALYGAYHTIEAVSEHAGRARGLVDIVGPVCESSDAFGKNRELTRVEEGELLAIRDCGAYGMVMGSTYNGRPRPAEVLVDGTEARLIRERDRIEDLWRAERLLDGSAPRKMLPDGLQRHFSEEG